MVRIETFFSVMFDQQQQYRRHRNDIGEKNQQYDIHNSVAVNKYMCNFRMQFQTKQQQQQYSISWCM